MTLHRCHAILCDIAIPPARFMCASHWRVLPRALQRRIWATYRPGQEQDKQPSPAYMEAAAAALHWMHEHEGKPGALCVVCLEAKPVAR